MSIHCSGHVGIPRYHYVHRFLSLAPLEMPNNPQPSPFLVSNQTFVECHLEISDYEGEFVNRSGRCIYIITDIFLCLRGQSSRPRLKIAWS